MVFAFHNNGGMYLRGPSFKEAGELPQGDLTVYNYLGNTIEKIVPGYEYLISWKDLYSTYELLKTIKPDMHEQLFRLKRAMTTWSPWKKRA